MDLIPTALYGEVWLSAEGIKAPGIKPATWVDHGLSGAWEFSDATDDTVGAAMRIPFRFNRDVAPTFNIGWSADGVSPGNCKWQIEYVWSALNQSSISPAQATLIAITAASAISNGMVLSTVYLEKPTIDDICIHARIKRLAADAEDTIVDTTELIGMCIRYKLLDWER